MMTNDFVLTKKIDVFQLSILKLRYQINVLIIAFIHRGLFFFNFRLTFCLPIFKQYCRVGLQLLAQCKLCGQTLMSAIIMTSNVDGSRLSRINLHNANKLSGMD